MDRPKYVYILANSVMVKIERGRDVHLKHFDIRRHTSLEHAIQEALKWRDRTHLECYGCPVSENIFKVKARKKQALITHPESQETLPSLPPGLGYGIHRGRVLYIVVSYQDNKTPKKKRFPINQLGLTSAINEAVKFRLDTCK